MRNLFSIPAAPFRKLAQGRALRGLRAAIVLGVFAAVPAHAAIYEIEFHAQDFYAIAADDASPHETVNGLVVIDVEPGVSDFDRFDFVDFKIDIPLSGAPYFDYLGGIGELYVGSGSLAVFEDGDIQLVIDSLVSGPLGNAAFQFKAGGTLFAARSGSYTVTTGGPSPVPLPATAPLLLAALGGAAAVRRRMAAR